MYRVARTYGRSNIDYLAELGTPWGTAWVGASNDRHPPLQFPDYATARAAARKARRNYFGWNFTKGRPARARTGRRLVEIVPRAA